ncbi:MAG TPA: ribonuclease activity regulator RraA [Caldilineaceae bacterium]|nr:ribonuclease activity regulator RraA [Caldilineaceae bacterium]
MADLQRPHALSPEAFAKLHAVSTATLTSQLMKRGFRNTFLAGLTPLRPDLRMVGYAFTLRYVPMREDLVDTLYDNTTNVQRLAVEAVGPDDVLVIDARGDTRAATLGNILATRLKVRGAAGLVTDGALRDTPGFKHIELPAYIKAAHATTSFAIHHPIEMNTPIGCAGVLVMPGDVMVGDGEGVVAIPAQVAEEVAHDAYEQERLEEFIQAKVASGASILGVYPPDEATKAEYEVWRRSQQPLVSQQL